MEGRSAGAVRARRRCGPCTLQRAVRTGPVRRASACGKDVGGCAAVDSCILGQLTRRGGVAVRRVAVVDISVRFPILNHDLAARRIGGGRSSRTTGGDEECEPHDCGRAGPPEDNVVHMHVRAHLQRVNSRHLDQPVTVTISQPNTPMSVVAETWRTSAIAVRKSSVQAGVNPAVSERSNARLRGLARGELDVCRGEVLGALGERAEVHLSWLRDRRKR